MNSIMALWFRTLAAAEDIVKVTDTSLLLVLSQWLAVETALPSSASNGLFSGNAVRGKKDTWNS